ncbi:MAG: DUF2071 domain-containing protein [Rhodothermales bacterium]|nr:DUF2071 domain-containing protein [Rhodothermales bacterium]
MKAGWRDLLFASWPIEPDAARAAVPPTMEVDIYNGSAWMTVVAMRVEKNRARILPPIPGFDKFIELNFRVYVHVGDAYGVFFVRIQTDRLFSDVAFSLFKVNIDRASMGIVHEEGAIDFTCQPNSSKQADSRFVAKYRPYGDAFNPEPGSLESFLYDRYCYFSDSGNGKVYRGDIAHPEWILHKVEADIEVNTVPTAFGIQIPDVQPHLGFSWGTDTEVKIPVRQR